LFPPSAIVSHSVNPWHDPEEWRLLLGVIDHQAIAGVYGLPRDIQDFPALDVIGAGHRLAKVL